MIYSCSNTKDERGLYVSQEIPAGSVIASLPLSSLMTIDTCAEIPSLNPLLSTSMREDDLLSLLLLYARFVLCDQSKFHMHILSLPKVGVTSFSHIRLNIYSQARTYL